MKIEKAIKEIKEMKLQTDISFNARITIQERTSKNNNVYQVMVVGVENKKTGEILNIHEIYIKEHLRQIIEFIINQNKE
jgi:FixJ family two-component response regulator